MQVVIVPSRLSSLTRIHAVDIVKRLSRAGFEAYADLDRAHNAGWKLAHWEARGVPLLIDFSERDVPAQLVFVRRCSPYLLLSTTLAELEDTLRVLLQ